MPTKYRRFFTLFALLAFALVVRGGILFFQPGMMGSSAEKTSSFDADPDDYRRLAQNLRYQGVLGSGGIPTAFRPPLYPAMLAGVSYLAPPTARPTSPSPDGDVFAWGRLTPNVAIALLHWVLGVATVLLVFRVAKRLGSSTSLAMLAAILVAIDPILLWQSRWVMTETAAAFFAILLIDLLLCAMKFPFGGAQRWGFFGVGLVTGLAVLLRPTFLVFGILIFVVLVIFELQRRLAWFTPAIFLAGMFLVLMPWGVRNRIELGRFILTTTHGGYTLLLANNPSLYDDLATRGVFHGAWNPEAFHSSWQEKTDLFLEQRNVSPLSCEGEILKDRLANEVAWETILSRPRDFALSVAARIGWLWQPMPYQTDSSRSGPAVMAVGLFYLSEWLMALVGLFWLIRRTFRRGAIFLFDRSAWIWPTLFILSVQIPHLVYWTNMRMRAPLMVVIPLFIGLAISRLRVWLHYRRKEKTDSAATLLGKI